MVEDEINAAENDWDEYFIMDLTERSKDLLMKTLKRIAGSKQNRQQQIT